MPTTEIDSAVKSNLTGVMTDYSVDAVSTDGTTEQKENVWDQINWAQYFGYYKKLPELRAVIDAKATWTVGKGFEADGFTTLLLDNIKGWGKDTFNTILENAIRTYQIGGDSFCEIIKNKKGKLINLKPLDPEVIRIVANKKGIITGYQQMSKTGKKKKVGKPFDPEQIFHLARNRVADEIHGQSMIEAIEDIILMKNEAMSDYKIVMHRFVKPRFIFHLDTDDNAEIATFKTKMDSANEKSENLYVPKDVIVPELMAVPPNATLNPLAWIESLDSKFYEAAQVPKIIVGGVGGITEAAVKIAYLAFQQTIEEEQLFIEEQVLSQLNLVIELEFPASLENELLSDEKKDGAQNIDASETTAGAGQ